jgi:hypothetical protein
VRTERAAAQQHDRVSPLLDRQTSIEQTGEVARYMSTGSGRTPPTFPGKAHNLNAAAARVAARRQCKTGAIRMPDLLGCLIVVAVQRRRANGHRAPAHGHGTLAITRKIG